MTVEITIQPTPNPNALKFIVDSEIKKRGKSNYKTIEECAHVPFAQHFFKLRGVDHIYFFQNTITVTKFGYEDWDELEPQILDTIERNIDGHNCDYDDPNPEEERRKDLSKELLEIEEIIDETIRPYLQGDGGDLTCESYQDNILIIRYQGACGTCPSSTMGTLEAIKNVLRERFNPEIEVYTAPSEEG